MAITKGAQANFNTLLRAARQGDLALIEGTDAKTGETRLIVAAVAFDGDEYRITPFGHLSSGNPYDDYKLPEVKG